MLNEKFLVGIVGLGWWRRKLFRYFNELEKVKIIGSVYDFGCYFTLLGLF